MSFAATWMNQEIVILSEVSQTEKEKYHMTSFIWTIYGGVNGDLLPEGLCHTQVYCTQSPCPCSSPLLTHTTAGDTVLAQFLWGLLVLVQTRFVWALRASLASMGFDSKCNFAPPTVFLGLLFCCWTWGIFFLVVSNVILSMAIQQWVVSPSINSITGPLPELTQDWGRRLLEGTNKSLCTPGPRRKEQWPHKRLTRTCPWVSRSLQQRCGSGVACCRVGGTECSIACMETFEEGHHYLHYLHHNLASGQTTRKEPSPTHQQKIGLNIY